MVAVRAPRGYDGWDGYPLILTNLSCAYKSAWNSKHILWHHSLTEYWDFLQSQLEES